MNISPGERLFSKLGIMCNVKMLLGVEWTSRYEWCYYPITVCLPPCYTITQVFLQVWFRNELHSPCNVFAAIWLTDLIDRTLIPEVHILWCLEQQKSIWISIVLLTSSPICYSETSAENSSASGSWIWNNYIAGNLILLQAITDLCLLLITLTLKHMWFQSYSERLSVYFRLNCSVGSLSD